MHMCMQYVNMQHDMCMHMCMRMLHVHVLPEGRGGAAYPHQRHPTAPSYCAILQGLSSLLQYTGLYLRVPCDRAAARLEPRRVMEE